MSGYQDSNLGPPGPKPGALAGLRYTPIIIIFLTELLRFKRLNKPVNPNVAERGGFEPPTRSPVRQFSKLLVSATHPSLLIFGWCKCRNHFHLGKIKVEKNWNKIQLILENLLRPSYSRSTKP